MPFQATAFPPARAAAALAAACLLVTACSREGAPDARSTEAFSGIAAGETVYAGGTEPFWNVTVEGAQATYTSPENLDGSSFAVERFAGNSGVAYSGTLDGADVVLAVTTGSCSDGMSDRDYPFVATLRWGDRILEGCAYTDRQRFTGPENP